MTNNNSTTPTFFRAQFSDIDEYIASLDGWNTDVDQLVSGRNQSSHLSVSLSDLNYVFYYHKLKSIHTVAQVGRSTSFLIRLGDEAGTLIDQKTDFPAICCIPSGETVTAVTPDNFSGVAIAISNEKIPQLLNYHYDGPAPFLKHNASHLYHLTPFQFNELKTLLLEIKANLNSAGSISQNKARWLRTISETKVFPMIFSIMANQSGLQCKLRPETFRNAYSMIRDNLDSPLSIADMSEHLGISTRNLQYLFKNHLGMTPKNFINVIRLNAVRKRLRGSHLNRVKISDIANELDFWHMGSFSKEFKKLFQLSPSDILRSNGKWADDSHNNNKKELLD